MKAHKYLVVLMGRFFHSYWNVMDTRINRKNAMNQKEIREKEEFLKEKQTSKSVEQWPQEERELRQLQAFLSIDLS